MNKKGQVKWWKLAPVVIFFPLTDTAPRTESRGLTTEKVQMRKKSCFYFRLFGKLNKR